MILCPKGNSMFLNTFPRLFWRQSPFNVLSATRNENGYISAQDLNLLQGHDIVS